MDNPVATILTVNSALATVSVDRAAVCARCAAGRGCGAGIFGSDRKPARIQVSVPSGLQLLVGDRVILTLQPEHLLRASFLIYGLPLIGIVAILSLGSLLAGPLNEASAIGLAVAGLCAGLLTGRKALAQSRCPEKFMPRISSLAEHASRE